MLQDTYDKQEHGQRSMGRQGEGRRLTDRERLEIAELARRDPTVRHVDLARRYSVNESTIRKWRREANADKVQRRYGRAGRATRDALQRGPSSRSERFEVALHRWIVEQRGLGRLPSSSKIREEARELAVRFDGMEHFKASTGWYYRFCARFDLPKSAAEHKKLAAAAANATSRLAVNGDVVETTAAARSSAAPGEPSNPTLLTADANSLPGSRFADDASLVLPSCSSRHIHDGRVAAGVGSDDDELLPAVTTEAYKAASPAPPSPPLDAARGSSERRMTVHQEAIAHFVAHHKGLVGVSCRLQLIRHLARAPGEAEMYVVMDDETRVEYIKEFAARRLAVATASVDGRGHVV